jgi:hypothetical protein
LFCARCVNQLCSGLLSNKNMKMNGRLSGGGG